MARAPPGRWVGRYGEWPFVENAGADMDGDGPHSMRSRKRRKGVFGVGGYVPVPLAAFEEPDGVRVKSATMIEDSD